MHLQKKSCTSHWWFGVAILTSTTTVGIKVHPDKGFSIDRVHTGIPTVAHVGLQRTRRQCRQQCPVTRHSGTINQLGCMTKLIFLKGAQHRCARDEPRLQKGMFRIPSCALESVLRSDLQKTLCEFIRTLKRIGSHACCVGLQRSVQIFGKHIFDT